MERRTVQITGRPEPYRRPSRTQAQIKRRPDRVALWAVLLGVFMVFMAVVTAQADASKWQNVTLGDRSLERGTAGSDVRTLQIVLTRRGRPVTADGYFGPRTRRAVRRFQRHHRLAADGVVGPMTIGALSRGWAARMATWYGPGLYGNGMACGGRLTKSTWGVAHKTLPCGTKVPMSHAGRIVIAPVVDRGPYAKGISYDLTRRTAGALRMLSTRQVRAGY